MAAKKKATKKKATKKKASKKTSSKKAAPMESLLVASKVKEQLRSRGLNVSGDALDGLNGYVYWLIDQAAKRTEANNRKTVRSHDFVVM